MTDIQFSVAAAPAPTHKMLSKLLVWTTMQEKKSEQRDSFYMIAHFISGLLFQEIE